MRRSSSAWQFLVYLVAWLIVGTFFVTCLYFADAAQSWGREGRWISGFLYTYAVALPGGLAIQLAAAIFLRVLTRAARLDGFFHWVAFGAALGIALPWAGARAGYLLEGVRFPHQWQVVKSVLMFPLMGAMMHETQPAWAQITAGAATAGTVWLAMREKCRAARRRS